MWLLGVVEGVQLGSIALCSLCFACMELGIFASEGDGGWGTQVEERNFVEHVGEPL